MKKYSLLFILLAFQTFAQNAPVEMADSFRSDGKIYVVIAVISVVLVGIFSYLFSLDQKLKKFESQK